MIVETVEERMFSLIRVYSMVTKSFDVAGIIIAGNPAEVKLRGANGNSETGEMERIPRISFIEDLADTKKRHNPCRLSDSRSDAVEE